MIYSAIDENVEAEKWLEAKTVLKLDRITYDIACSAVSNDDLQQRPRDGIEKLVDKWQLRLGKFMETETKRLKEEKANGNAIK